MRRHAAPIRLAAGLGDILGKAARGLHRRSAWAVELEPVHDLPRRGIAWPPNDLGDLLLVAGAEPFEDAPRLGLGGGPPALGVDVDAGSLLAALAVDLHAVIPAIA